MTFSSSEKALDDVLDERLAAEQLELLRQLAAETGAGAGGRDDDERWRHHTAMMSCSLCFSTDGHFVDVLVGQLLDLGLGALLVVLGDLVSLSIFLSLSLPSRRTWRMAVRDSSAMTCAFFTSSLRRSSVSTGIGTRMTLPSDAGLRPRSELRMAFSMATDHRLVPRLDDDAARAPGP